MLHPLAGPEIILGRGSPLYPQGVVGGHITMYREFQTEGDPQMLNVTWSRTPCCFYQCFSNSRNSTTLVSSDTLKASLTAYNLKIYPDFGTYVVKACSNCTCNETTFVFFLFNCTQNATPQPAQLFHEKIIAETSIPPIEDGINCNQTVYGNCSYPILMLETTQFQQ